MRKRSYTFLSLFLLASLFAISVPTVVAPPVGEAYVCGLISSLESDIRILYTSVNASVIPNTPDGENLTFFIDLSAKYNITNMAEENTTFLTSYVENWILPEFGPATSTRNISIEGNTSLYDASFYSNITSLEGLPMEIQSRFPFSLDPYQIGRGEVVNLTLKGRVSLVLTTRTIIETPCYWNFLDFRFGLDMDRLAADATQLNARIELSNSSLLVRTDFQTNHSINMDQEGDTEIASWSISKWNWESTYWGMILSHNVFNEYLGVLLWQSLYYPPRISYSPGSTYFDLPVLLAIVGFGIMILFFVLLRKRK